MTNQQHCRECKTALPDPCDTIGLCAGCDYMAADWRYYDQLREEGHGVYQAKLMAGLADPPDPDDD